MYVWYNQNVFFKLDVFARRSFLFNTRNLWTYSFAVSGCTNLRYVFYIFRIYIDITDTYAYNILQVSMNKEVTRLIIRRLETNHKPVRSEIAEIKGSIIFNNILFCRGVTIRLPQIVTLSLLVSGGILQAIQCIYPDYPSTSVTFISVNLISVANPIFKQICLVSKTYCPSQTKSDPPFLFFRNDIKQYNKQRFVSSFILYHDTVLLCCF